ncbi:MAG: glycosyltransferase family 4 protein [Sedimentisphaerales bacterium]|nr:glycosyltransferase family 4 protein [Sedimentisphaerales bacterium]
MKILMVLSTKTFPPDGRVEREARDLIRGGHDLYIMARRGPGQKAFEVVNGVKVIRVPLPFQSKKAVADFIYFFFQRYFIYFHILLACRRYRIEALHVHDLPYAFATALAGKTLRLPVIFDMHEYYTVMLGMSFEAKVYRKFKMFSFILLWMLSAEEKVACRWSDKVIIVAEEHADRIESLGVKPEDIIVVTNTEDIDHFSGLAIDGSIKDLYGDGFVILYVGGFSPHRGLDTAIQAMPKILEKIPDAKLLMVGDGCNRQELEDLAGEMNLQDKVIFTGFQPFETLPSYIDLCDIGLIPHISTPHIETTMPNKIFQFMMLERAVVTSNVRPLVRIINDADCGGCFKERDPDSLAETIIGLYDSGLRNRLANNGKKAVQEKYNWQKTVQILLELYSKDIDKS